MTNVQPSNLYWIGGLFRVRLDPNLGTPQHAVAVSLLKEFRTDCQKQYLAFSRMVNGRHLAYEQFRSIIKPEDMDKPFSEGSVLPGSEQSPGKSVIAEMSQGELLEGLKEGGEFENQHGKALLILIYHRWCEHFRKRIADAMSVPIDQVECDLMGDIRLVRNMIIHENSVISHGFSTKLKLLPEIKHWNLEPGALTITEKMVHSLMEQINAIQVRVTEGKQT